MEKLLDILVSLLVVMTRHHANMNDNFQPPEMREPAVTENLPIHTSVFNVKFG